MENLGGTTIARDEGKQRRACNRRGNRAKLDWNRSPRLVTFRSDFVLTFLEAVYLFVREGSSVALQFPLQPQPHLRVLVPGGVVLRITIRSCLLLMRQ